MQRPSVRRSTIALGIAATLAAGAVSTAAPASAATTVHPCQQLGATTLREGHSGPAVRALQICLFRIGMVVLHANGTFDDNTKHAVITAQKVGGLPRDGAVGPKTKAWLRTARPVVMPPAPNNKPRTAVVDIARQVMFLYIAGRTRVIDVSTGSEQWYTNPDGSRSFAHTPRGYFLINRHYVGERQSALGTLFYPAYFNLTGHAVHGSNSVPIYPASHGCVRVTRALERVVQQALAVGTHIYIR